MLGQLQQFFSQPQPTSSAGLHEISLEYTEEQLSASTNGFNRTHRLGGGTFGDVYKGTLKDGSEVAIKKIEVTPEEGGGFLEEVRVLSRFRHPNLVTLMGWGKSGVNRYLVYELLQGGDVQQRLSQCKFGSTPFYWDDRLSVALDAACGLSHMHNSTPKAFHRDIKSPNILLDKNGVAKMADFGLAGIAKKKDKLDMTCEQVGGTPGYACPKYITSGKVTEEAEIFSYGMVMFELLLNCLPAAAGPNGEIFYPIFQMIMPQAPGARDRTLKAVDPSASWSPQLSGELVDLALRCVSMQEGERPKFAEIVLLLRGTTERFPTTRRGSGARDHGPPAVHGYPQAQAPGGYPGPGGYAQAAPGATPPTKPQMGIPGQAQVPPGGPVPMTNPQLQNAPGPYGAAGFQQLQQEQNQKLQQQQQQQQQQQAQTHYPAAQPYPAAQQPPDVAGTIPKHPQANQFIDADIYHGGQNIPGVRTGVIPKSRPNYMYDPNVMNAPAPEPEKKDIDWNNIAIPESGFICSPPTEEKGMSAFFARISGWWSANKGQEAGEVHTEAELISDVAEVVLHCTRADGVDLSKLAERHRCHALFPGQENWNIGRIQQPNLFSRLVPDQANLGCISRCHFELKLEATNLWLRKVSPNPLLIGGVPAPQEGWSPIPHGTEIAFCGMANNVACAPFLVFTALLRDSATVAQMGHTPLPTRPDVPGVVHPELMKPPQPRVSKTLQPFVLSCIYAKGIDVKSLPPQARRLGVPSEGQIQIGKQQQPGLFEGLLVADPKLLAFISRNHFVIEAVPNENGTFKVTNLSGNPIFVNQQRLDTQAHAKILAPAKFEFPAVKAGSTPDDTYIFLAFSLDPESGPGASAAPKAPGGPTAMPVPGASNQPSQPIPPAPAPHPTAVGEPPQHLQQPTVPGTMPGGIPPPQKDQQQQQQQSPPYQQPQQHHQQPPPYQQPQQQHQQPSPYQQTQQQQQQPSPYQQPQQQQQQQQQQPPYYQQPMQQQQQQQQQPGAQQHQQPSLLASSLQPAQDVTPRSKAKAKATAPLAVQENPVAESFAPAHLVAAARSKTEANHPCSAGIPGPQDGPFSLEFRGSALRDDFPRAQRFLAGTSSGLAVGRNHQAQLHAEALREGVMQFISREHFRIDCPQVPTGHCSVVAISANPMWRGRGGQRTQLKKGEPLTICNGDEVILYTGASDLSIDGPGNKGSLFWLFHDFTGAPEIPSEPQQDLEQTTAAHQRRDRRSVEFKEGPTSPMAATNPMPAWSRNAASGVAAATPMGRAPTGAPPQSGALSVPIAGGFNIDDDDGEISPVGGRSRVQDLDLTGVQPGDRFASSGFNFKK